LLRHHRRREQILGWFLARTIAYAAIVIVIVVFIPVQIVGVPITASRRPVAGSSTRSKAR
jgi:hypothetical protein